MIGTLYCAKGNFEFGISRIIKSLEPYDKKLGTDTWYVGHIDRYIDMNQYGLEGRRAEGTDRDRLNIDKDIYI